MKDKICATLTKEHIYICSSNVIGRSGENECTQLEITLDECLCDKWVYLDFIKPDGSTYKTSKLEVTDNKIVYDIPNSLLDQKGNLQVQAVLQDESGEVWKSTIKSYGVNPSINATDDIPNKDDFITEAQNILNEFEKAIETIVIDGSGYKFLCDDGKYKEVGGSTGGTRDYNNLDNKPSINNVELAENKTLDDLGIQPKGDYALSSEIPNVSDFITEDEVDKKIDAIEIPEGHTHTNKAILDNITQENIDAWNNSGSSNFSGSYNDLTDKPTIPTVPTNVSSFTNDAGYLTEIPSEYVTETELNEAISNVGGGTGNVSSDVINSIVVVDELPTVEEIGVLYLIKDTGTSTDPETPEIEVTNLYYQSEPKDYTSSSSGYNLLWGTDCTILFNSNSELTKDREQLSGDFTLNLVEGKTYKLKATYVSGEMSSSSGTPSFNISLQNSDTSTKYCSVNTNDMADMETTFTATATETISAAKMGVYVYTGTQYTNLIYNITITEVV